MPYRIHLSPVRNIYYPKSAVICEQVSNHWTRLSGPSHPHPRNRLTRSWWMASFWGLTGRSENAVKSGIHAGAAARSGTPADLPSSQRAVRDGHGFVEQVEWGLLKLSHLNKGSFLSLDRVTKSKTDCLLFDNSLPFAKVTQTNKCIF